MKILTSTFPFGKTGSKPLDILEKTGWEIIANPYGRRLKAGEVKNIIQDVDAVVAGTEPYDAETLKNANNLKVIARVGIGLDSVDLKYCKEHNIQVTYTPDAPSQGVAELTVANILNLIRHIHESDRSVRENAWNRLMGRLVKEVKIGIIGVGRIGSKVINLLEPFQPTILANDINPDVHGKEMPCTKWCSVDDILTNADLISVHIPMSEKNSDFINRERIAQMKTGAMLINTSRGGILDEEALTDALLQKHLGGAALDVYKSEPYHGLLTKMDNVILTAHIAASARASRYLMELGAAEDCIRVLNNEKPKHDAFESLEL